jgi:hypothetical protein
MSPASAASRAGALALSVVASQGTDLDGAWASDHWQASRLGVPARRGLAAGAGQTLVPVPPGHRLCLFDNFGRGASDLTVL